jgi:capsular exopolysaccharide synthesis family protein
MKARIGQDLETARRRENSLTSGYGNQARVASESSARLIHYDSLKHEVEVTRSFYQGMMQKVNEAGVASAIRPSNIRITGKAEIPYVPVSPNIPLLTLMGLAGGLVAGCCLALTREIGFVPADAADAVVHPVLVPELGGGLRSKVLGTWVGDLIPPGENAAAYGLSVQRQSTGLPESYRGAAVSLLSSVVNGKKPQVIAVTSAGTLEGKTTAVCNLGIALSELGRRVLLIDGDLRGPQLKSVLGGVVETGLTTLLSGRPEIRDIPQEFLSIRTAVHNLNLLPSGGAEVHSVDLFCSQRMEDLMKRLRSLFDFVLIDAPAASIVSDTKVLGLHTDGVVLIRSGISNDEATIAAARHFSMEGLPVIGTIHNSSEYRTGTIMGNYRGLHTASSGAGVRL